jgi:septal ring factor EnvC (AmiA/AmiB activator)
MEIPNEVEEVEEVTTHTPEVYPIVTIYILGYSLKDLPYLAVSVKRKVINSIDQSEVESSSFFINHLTHESHILQITRLPEKRSTTLERFLSFFNQAWISDRNFILDLEEVPEEFSDIAHYLQGVVGDAAFRRRLEAEEEIDAIFNAQEAKYQKEIASAKAAAEDAKLREEAAIHREAEAKLREDEAKLREEEAKLREEEAKLRAEEAKLRAEEALRREDVAKHRESEAMLKLARNMKKWGEPAEDIAKETGLDLDTISSL